MYIANLAIFFRSHNDKYGIFLEISQISPNIWRNNKSDVWLVQNEFQLFLSVVGLNFYASAYGKDNFGISLMRVSASVFAFWDFGSPENPFHLERNVLQPLEKAEASSLINNFWYF